MEEFIWDFLKIIYHSIKDVYLKQVIKKKFFFEKHYLLKINISIINLLELKFKNIIIYLIK
jgi:hypothetical protein